MVTRKLFESSVIVDYLSVDDLLEFIHSHVLLFKIVGDLRKTFNCTSLIGQKQIGGSNRS